MTADMMLRYAVALAIGMLVGLERGWREREEPSGHRIAGIRTYAITGLLGAVVGSLTAITGSSGPLIASIVIYGVLFGVLQLRKTWVESEFSITGHIAGMLVLVLGSLSVIGDYKLAAAGGVALAGLLASREILHTALRSITWIEIRSAIVLAAMTAIVLPLLPDRTLDPWGGFNPKEVWLLTVLTAALSYLGYIAARLIGPSKGALITGLTGGLVSSTSVTVAFARSAKQNQSVLPLVAGACTAAMISVLRVCVLVGLIRPELLPAVGPAAVASALTLGLSALLMLFVRGDSEGEASQATRNPFDLQHLLVFALGFAIISTLSAAFVGHFGTSSVVASAILSGAFDVDIAVLATVRLDGTAVTPEVIALAILAALAANAAGRLLLASLSGPVRFFLPLGGATVAAIVVGLAVFSFAN